jgi:hypothetical protein
VVLCASIREDKHACSYERILNGIGRDLFTPKKNR